MSSPIEDQRARARIDRDMAEGRVERIHKDTFEQPSDATSGTSYMQQAAESIRSYVSGGEPKNNTASNTNADTSSSVSTTAVRFVDEVSDKAVASTQELSGRIHEKLYPGREDISQLPAETENRVNKGKRRAGALPRTAADEGGIAEQNKALESHSFIDTVKETVSALGQSLSWSTPNDSDTSVADAAKAKASEAAEQTASVADQVRDSLLPESDEAGATFGTAADDDMLLKAKRSAEETASTVKSKTAEAADAAKAKASEAAEQTSSVADQVRDSLLPESDETGATFGTAADDDMLLKAKRSAEETTGILKNKASEASQRTQELASKGADKAQHAVDSVREAMAPTSDESGSTFGSAFDEGDPVETISQQAEEVLEETRRKSQVLAERARDSLSLDHGSVEETKREAEAKMTAAKASASQTIDEVEEHAETLTERAADMAGRARDAVMNLGGDPHTRHSARETSNAPAAHKESGTGRAGALAQEAATKTKRAANEAAEALDDATDRTAAATIPEAGDFDDLALQHDHLVPAEDGVQQASEASLKEKLKGTLGSGADSPTAA